MVFCVLENKTELRRLLNIARKIDRLDCYSFSPRGRFLNNNSINEHRNAIALIIFRRDYISVRLIAPASSAVYIERSLLNAPCVHGSIRAGNVGPSDREK